MTRKSIRVTMHNGRTNSKGKAYNPNHNDRNFTVSDAPHIDKERLEHNIYWTCYSEKPFTGKEKGQPDDPRYGFIACETTFYEENFRVFLEARNRKRKESRHYKEVQTMDDYRGKRTSCPEETLFYLGGRNNFADPKFIAAIMQDFIKWHERKFPSVRFLNWALHQDERGAPHIHLRKVWTAYDEEGRLFVGQEAALMQMGIEASKGKKTKTKEGKEVEKARYNNRKVTYTAETRAKLQELARQYGYTIEDNPRPKSEAGRSLNEYIASEEQKKAREAEQRAAQAAKDERHATAAVVLLTQQQQERLQAISEKLDKLDATGWTAALDTLDGALKGFTLKPSTKEARTDAAAARAALEGIADTVEKLRAFCVTSGETTEQAAAYASLQRRLTRTRNAISREEKRQRDLTDENGSLATKAANERAEQWTVFIQEMQATLARAKEEADAKEKERAEEHRRKLADLDAEAARRAQKILQSKRNEVADLAHQKATLEGQKVAAQKDLEKKQEALQAALDDLQRTTRDTQTKQKNLQAATTEIQKLQPAVERLRGEKETLQSSVEVLQSTEEAMQTRLSRLDATLEKKSEDVIKEFAENLRALYRENAPLAFDPFAPPVYDSEARDARAVQAWFRKFFTVLAEKASHIGVSASAMGDALASAFLQQKEMMQPTTLEKLPESSKLMLKLVEQRKATPRQDHSD